MGHPLSGATRTDDPRRPKRSLMEHNPPSPVGSWPAIPPSPMGPMSTAREPSLEFCSEPELMEQSNEILMEAMRRHHDSLAEKLQHLDARVQQIAESLCHGRRLMPMRRSSTHSNASAVEYPSQNQKRLQADSLAMEVLQMDISHLGAGRLPTRSMSLKKLPAITRRKERTHSTNSTPKKEKEVEFSILPSTPALPGVLEQGPMPREATRSVTEETDGWHRSVGASTGLPSGSCSRDQEDSRGRLAQDSRSFSKDESQLMPRSSTSASKSIHRGNSQSSALAEGTEPQEDVKSMKSFHRGSSLNSAFLAEVAESQEDGKSSRGENTPKESSKRSRAVSQVSSGGGKEKTRRASAVLDRAVSKGNLSEVFRLREQELTATLSHRPSGDPQNSSVKSREKATMLQELTNEDGGTSESADEVEIGHKKSLWLRFGRLNTWVSVHASKALGLVPLFDDLESTGWRRRCRKVASRLYHWLLVAFLIYGIVKLAIELSICSGEDQDETCSSYWPPLAVDMLLLVGAVMVMCSRGGFLNYSGNTRIVAQSVQELAVYCEQNGLDEAFKIWIASDALWALVVWLLMLGGRFGRLAFNAWAEETSILATLDVIAIYSLATGVLVVSSFWQFRTSHAMLLIVNSWSASLLRGDESCIQSKKEWKRVSGLFRKTSRAFERCFSALAATIVLLILSALFDMSRRWNVEMLASISFAFILPGVLWTAATTTTACNRLPSLVILCEVDDEDEDAEYMDLAMFLSLSECGFFVWDTCVTIGLVQKFLYFTTAVAGSIGFQVGAFQLAMAA